MSTTLPLFWHLSSGSKKERIDASVKLIGSLEQFQAQFTPKDITADSSGEEDLDEDGPKPDGLEGLNAQDVSYSIRRLVRGLASPRESSRLGFAVALTELLSRIETVTCSQIVSLIIDSSKTSGSMTGQEERDVLFARLFGLTAVVQSGLLVRQGDIHTSAYSAPASDLSCYQETVTHLLALGEKKSWLRESAWWTISLAIDALTSSKVLWKDSAMESAVENIFIENTNWSPEKIGLALKLQSLRPELNWRKYLSPSFKSPDLLGSGNMGTLARILKESTSDDDSADVPTSSSGLWKPQLHFVWDVLLDQLLPSPNSTSASKGSFQEFFRIVVDESLFSSSSSPERKYWGFQVFQKALPRVTETDIPMLFTKNFMRSWINHLSNKDRYLHKVSRQVATEIQAFVNKNPTLGFSLILQLTGINGSRQFDKLTKTKTVESILASMNADGISDYIDYLLKLVNEGDAEQDDIRIVNSRRAWVIDQFCALIRNSSVPKTDNWIQSVLDWLAINGLFVVHKSSSKSPYRGLHVVPTPAFSEELRQNCRTRLLSCLADLTVQTTAVKSGNDKVAKVNAVASDGELWVWRVLNTITQLEKDTKHVLLVSELEQEAKELRIKGWKVAEKLRKVSGDQQEAAKGAELLLLAALLQNYCTDESEETDDESLEACIDGATRMFLVEGKARKKSLKSQENGAAELALEPVDILVDTIIGFMEESTTYMRVVSNHVFSLLSGSIQGTTIDLILTQLERRVPAEIVEDDDADDDEVVEDAAGGDDDEKEIKDSGDEGEENSSEESDDVDDSNDEAVDPALRQKIEEALRVNGIEAATGDSDEESEEELMDDEQMMAIDEQLAEVFRARANEKKARKDTDAQRDATHFKNRVLDLVDTYIKRQPSSPHLIRFILPLVDLIVGTGSDERQLSDKATGLLKNRIGKLKEAPPSVDGDEVAKVLENLHRKARKVRSSELLASLSQCSLYLSKVALQSGAEEPVYAAYKESLVDFITRKASSLNNKFFEDFIRRIPATAWGLRDDLVDVSGKAANVYRRCQAFQLIQVLISQSSLIDNRQQEFLKFVPTLRHALYDFMSNATSDKVALTAPQMRELFKLGLVSVRQTKRAVSDPEELSVIWQPSSWETLRGKLAATDRFKSSNTLHTMCQQMIQTSQATASNKAKKLQTNDAAQAKSAKRKAEDAVGDEGGGTTSRKSKSKKVKKDKI